MLQLCKLFDINDVVIEIIKANILKNVKVGVLRAKRPHPFGTTRPEMGQNGHYGAKPPFLHNNGHNQ